MRDVGYCAPGSTVDRWDMVSCLLVDGITVSGVSSLELDAVVDVRAPELDAVFYATLAFRNGEAGASFTAGSFGLVRGVWIDRRICSCKFIAVRFAVMRWDENVVRVR